MSGHFEEVSISKADVLTQQPSGLATDREDLKFNFGMRREPKGKLGQRKPFAPAAVKQRLMDLKIFYALFFNGRTSNLLLTFLQKLRQKISPSQQSVKETLFFAKQKSEVDKLLLSTHNIFHVSLQFEIQHFLSVCKMYHKYSLH